ncbi:MAG: hypothetical protein AAGE37_02360 [Pseudomonadota bacterium]
MTVSIDMLPDIPSDLISDVKDFLRLDHDQDDAALSDLVVSAVLLCENFTRQLLIARTVTEVLPVRNIWQRLSQLPVQVIGAAEDLASDGMATDLAVDDYAVDIDSEAYGWLRLNSDAGLSRLRVTYIAGLAEEWTDVPASLRQGIVRMAGYLYANRDDAEADGPPHAVTALWQPHRRIRIR